METLWATSKRPISWFVIVDSDKTILRHGLRTYLIREFMPTDWKEIILTRLTNLRSSHFSSITNFNHAFNLALRQLDNQLRFWQIRSIYLNAIGKETAKFLEASPDKLFPLEALMTRAIKVASCTEPTKHTSQSNQSDASTANVTVARSGNKKEFCMDQKKKQRGGKKGNGTVNLGDSKPDAPGSSSSGGHGGGGPGESGAWNGGMKGKALSRSSHSKLTMATP